MTGLIRFCRGFVAVRVIGAELDCFLNLCAVQGILFWGHKRRGFDEMELFLMAQDVFSLRPIARKTHAQIHILSRHGLPFHLRRIRPVLAAGAIMVVLTVLVLSRFLWSIEIYGTDAASRDEISNALFENGVRTGAYLKHLNTEDIRNQILIDHPEFVYLNINLHGSRAEVLTKRRVRPPEIVREDGCANIVAKEGGVIERITVYEGTPEVSPGDLVVPGQLLANGYMTGRSGVSVPTRARADVYARTWERKNTIYAREAQEITLTGERVTTYTLVFGKKRIKIFQKGSIGQADCDRILKKTQLSLPFGLTLPLTLERESAQICRLDRGLLPLPYAVDTAVRISERSLVLADTDRLCDLRFSAVERNGAVVLEMIAECVKQIGVQQ